VFSSVGVGIRELGPRREGLDADHNIRLLSASRLGKVDISEPRPYLVVDSYKQHVWCDGGSCAATG
jgi:hypothetical protein